MRPRGLCVPLNPAPRLRRACRLDASVLVPNLRHALLLTLTVDVGIVVIHVVHLPSPVVSTTGESSPANRRWYLRLSKNERAIADVAFSPRFRVFDDPKSRSPSRGRLGLWVGAACHSSCSFLVPSVSFSSQKRRKRPFWVALGGRRSDAAGLAGAPPLEGFAKDETAVTPLHHGERSRRDGVDDLTLCREVTVQILLLSRK